MRTEDDLRAALQALADTAPDAEDVLARLRRSERTERRSVVYTPVLVGISALATAAAAVVVPIGLGLPRDDVHVAAPSVRTNPTWQGSFDLDLPAGYTVRSWGMSSKFQSATVQARRDASCEVIVYAEDAFEQWRLPARLSPVLMHQTTGYFANFSEPASRYPETRQRIAWPYSASAWATTACDPTHALGWPALRDIAHTVALSVRHVQRRVMLPYRINYLPPSMTAATGRLHTSIGYSSVVTKTDLTGTPDPASTQGVDGGITTMLTEPASKAASGLDIRHRRTYLKRHGGALDVRVGAYPAQLLANENWARLYIRIDDHEVVLEATAQLAEPPASALLKIAATMEFAPDITNQSTWFDAAHAIP